jgi:endonuclease/exonuclease/phosphatase family metal-dependent hydrolase
LSTGHTISIRERARRVVRSLLLVALVPPVFVSLAALGNGRTAAPTNFRASPLLREAAPALAAPLTLRVVTFNIAAGYGFTNNRSVRLRAIAELLRELDPDLVGLQEAFIAADREELLRSLEGSRLRHHVRFPGATVGNGLWILSAHPIEEAWFHRFEQAGRWYRLWEGDWWAGKGIGLARVRLPGGERVDFFDTHAQAGRGNPENEEVRLGQMDELARFVREARLPGVPAFVVGDFNTQRGWPDYELAVRGAELARLMRMDSEIDHVFGVRDPALRYEVLETAELGGRIASPRPEIFLDRAPTLGELRTMWFGPPGSTRLSDHPGYLSTVRISPAPRVDVPSAGG